MLLMGKANKFSSEQSRRDCETIANLGLKAKILTHVRCNMEDARLAVETGVDGVDVVVRPSSNQASVRLLMMASADRLERHPILESIRMERTCLTLSKPQSRSSSVYPDYALESRTDYPPRYVKSTGKEIRFSSEDSFRSDLVDLLSIYSAVDKVGVTRVRYTRFLLRLPNTNSVIQVGIADTVGVATPREVYDLV
ncbi:MAG: hypothetical protein Q9178_000307 [Gyalolechia marmorata]